MASLKDLLGDKYHEGLTVEEIEAALTDVEIPADNTAEVEKLRSALTKSNGEAADYKRQLRERMSEEEQRAKDAQDAQADLERKYNELLHENQVSKYTANLVGMGYEESLARDTAEAMANGETDKVFANQKKHLNSVEKRVRAETLKDTPKPAADGSSTAMTMKQLRAMSPQERYTFSQEHPEEYKALYSTGDSTE